MTVFLGDLAFSLNILIEGKRRVERDCAVIIERL